jgi:TcpE family
VELPTYTNIWKIEKRLYKLYDFRLPMPLPVGQVTVFLAIAVPYMLILTLAGMPFSHTWVWLYVLPPGVLAWLVTRPVLEGKRLPELVLSQVRYLAEPRTWCRMMPAAEKDHVIVIGQVWRAPASLEPATLYAVAEPSGVAEPPGAAERSAVAETSPVAEPSAAGPDAAVAPSAPARPAWPDRPAVHPLDRTRGASARTATSAPEAAPDAPAGELAARLAAGRRATAPAASTAPGPAMAISVPVPPIAVAQAVAVPASADVVPAPGVAVPASADVVPASGVAASASADAALGSADVVPASADVERAPTDAAPATAVADAADAASARTFDSAGAAGWIAQLSPRRAPLTGRPAVTVHTDSTAGQPLHVVERALRSSPVGAGAGWGDRVVVVPGGHRPGKPDHVQRDQARARLPLPGPVRIVVLGSTAGAGQTVTALLIGQLLTTLRGEAVAVLDLCAGPGSITELARQIPRLLPGRPPTARTDPVGSMARDRALQVVTAEHTGSGPRDAGQLIDAVCARYPLTIADPPAGDVPRALQAADQLVLVSPASPDAAGSLAMTLEWLEAHGHTRLVQESVTVLNGVSAQTAAHGERAAGVAIGRCRAVVRVPWDARLSDGGALNAETVRAFTALAGVLISGRAASGPDDVPAAEAPWTGENPAGQVIR